MEAPHTVDERRHRFTSVWGALEDTPQAAASMRARSDFTMTLAAFIQKN